MTEIPAIGETDRLLHIGPHKTGSTAIQVALANARERLAEAGVYYPRGGHRRGAASAELFDALRTADGRPTPLWDDLVAEVAAAAPGRRVCVSDERFGKASAEAAARVVQDLGGGCAHVAAVARGYDRYLPSQWQERVKSSTTLLPYDEWLRLVLDPESDHVETRNVWHAHDTGALVERWTALVGADRFTVIVAEEGNHERLPRTFEALLGLSPGLLATDPDQSNVALSLGQVELLRVVATRLREQGLPRETYLTLFKRARKQVRAMPRSGPSRPLTPRWAREAVAERSAARIAFLRRTDVRVVGDPDWLRSLPADQPVPGEGDSGTPDADLVRGLVDDLLRRVATT